jgi:hypothetical protein
MQNNEKLAVTVQVVEKGQTKKTSKNLHVRPGSLLKNLAVYMFEGCKGQTSFIARGKAASIGKAATGA